VYTIDLFTNKLVRIREIVHLSFISYPLTPSMRIRRITLSTLASHHRDQSLLAHRHIIPPSSPASSLALPFITSLAYHFVSSSHSSPNTHHNRARIGHHLRVISAQRRATSQNNRTKAVRVQCRFWPAYDITVRPGSDSGPDTARWLPLTSAFTALSRRIRYY